MGMQIPTERDAHAAHILKGSFPSMVSDPEPHQTRLPNVASELLVPRNIFEAAPSALQHDASCSRGCLLSLS